MLEMDRVQRNYQIFLVSYFWFSLEIIEEKYKNVRLEIQKGGNSGAGASAK